MTTLYLHQSTQPPAPVAVNFTPSNPPPVCILQTWLNLANVTNQTAAQLRAALMTGKDVPLGAGWLRWHEE